MTLESSNNDTYNWSAALRKKQDDFKCLLDSIESLDEKTKVLWMDIYFNAFNDRMLSQNLFDTLWPLVRDNPDSHAIHGQTLAKYVEKLTKSNDQIIKLADLVEKAKEKDEVIDADDIMKKIHGGKR